MPKRLLPFIPASLRVIAVSPEPERVTVLAVPRSTTPSCPACRTRSDRAHGHYKRCLADLPWQCRSVCLRLHLRRLRCGNPACPRCTFTKSLPDLAVPHDRRNRAPLRRIIGLEC
ncbi:transposase family protein [Methylorubrum sp. SL192]|uniref:transposase family protein n=1 Tax=Methylorubrum sp. SL192 TaxID=2995167 RepID=UPI0022723D14|nr:transposase family protein [Methylorubrum sp. SL192]MCY1640638.1 transposase family protein [Methylorubrum sp. SL192]